MARKKKVLDRALFSASIWMQQLIMGALIYTHEKIPCDFDLNTMMVVIVTTFCLGQLMEWIFHLYLYPFAETKGNWWNVKKNAVLFATFIIATVAVVVICHFLITTSPPMAFWIVTALLSVIVLLYLLESIIYKISG